MTEGGIGIVVTVGSLDEDSAPLKAIENLVSIHEGEVDHIWIVGPTTTSINDPLVELVPVQGPSGGYFPTQVLAFALYQFRLALAVNSIASETETVYFHIGGTLSPLPVLTASLRPASAVVIVTGSPPDNYTAQHADGLPTRLISKTLGVVEQLTCALSDKIVVLSESMREGLLPRWASTERHVASMNYIKTADLDTPPPTATRDNDIMFVGRFTSEKGVQQLVRVVPELVDAYPDLSVELVGDGPLRSELEAAVEANDVTENVTFTGWLDRERVVDHLKNARILVIPSYSEGLPKVLLEGMVSGTVPVATRVGGIGDVIRDGENGVLVADNSREKLTEALTDVLERDDFQGMSDDARRTIEEEFSFDAARRAYLDILDDASAEDRLASIGDESTASSGLE